VSTIEVAWPDGGPLSETQWRERLESLAQSAESQLQHPHETTLQDRARLAVEWLGLCWSGFSAGTIAASCRASLLVGENVIVAAAPVDQIVEHLDGIWQQADADPAAVVEVLVPMLETGPVPDQKPRNRRRRPKVQAVEPEALEPAAEVLAVKPAAPSPAADADDLPLACSEAEPPAAVPADLEPEPAVEELELELQPVAAEPPESPAAVPEPTPADTINWLGLEETAELLERDKVTVGRWRIAGQLGQEGMGWVAEGRSFLFNPGLIEAALDRLAAQREERSNRAPRRRPCSADHRPDGWMVPDEVAAILGCSGSKIRRDIREGIIPAAMVHRVGLRSQWLDPAVVELLAQKNPSCRTARGLASTGGELPNPSMTAYGRDQ